MSDHEEHQMTGVNEAPLVTANSRTALPPSMVTPALDPLIVMLALPLTTNTLTTRVHDCGALRTSTRPRRIASQIASGSRPASTREYVLPI